MDICKDIYLLSTNNAVADISSHLFVLLKEKKSLSTMNGKQIHSQKLKLWESTREPFHNGSMLWRTHFGPTKTLTERHVHRRGGPDGRNGIGGGGL